MTEREVVGRAKALQMGQYPQADGRARIVSPGEEFDLLKGLEKGRWFEVLEPAKPDARPARPAPRPASIS